MNPPSASGSAAAFALKALEWFAFAVIVRIGWEVGGKLWTLL